MKMIKAINAMNKIKARKENIRIKINKRIIHLKDRKEKDKKIQDTLLKLKEIKEAELIHCYQSLKDEVSTKSVLKLLKDKIIVAPQRKAHLKAVNANVFIIPCRAFDLSCNRLGRGSGYYDLFLKNVKGKKITLAYEEQLAKIPVEEHDQKIDMIITEKRIIKINKD